MLRGFRWQLAALLVGAGLFVVSLVIRSSGERDTIAPTPTPTDTPVVIETPVPEAFTPVPTVIAPAAVAPLNAASDAIPTYHEGLVGSVQRLNPLFADLNPVDQDIASLIFEGLTRINTYGEPEPGLAAEWVISSDGLEYVFTLRDDILWQDGVPFTARDVIFTMTMLRAPDFPGSTEQAAFWRTVETELLGDHLVRFRLSQPLGSFLSALRIGILPEHALQGITGAQLASHPFNLSPIGTGPYQLEALRSQQPDHIQVVDLRVAPVYRQRPEGQTGYALERLRFHLFETFDDALTALRNGDIDGLAAQNPVQRSAMLNIGSTFTTVEPALGVLIFNWAKEDQRFFKEQRVRWALAAGLDRAGIVQRHLSAFAVPADSPLLPGSWAYRAGLPWPPVDTASAQTLLETVDLASDEDAPESDVLMQFAILTPDVPALVEVAQEIAAQWSQLDLGVTVESADLATYQQRLKDHDFDAALVELTLDTDPDVYAFWHEGQYPDGSNYGGVDDRGVSELLERARRDANGINRSQLYRDFQQHFVERIIALPLYYPLYTYVTAPHITGTQLGFVGVSADRFRTIRDWTIEPPQAG